MKKRHDPDDGEGEQDGRTRAENALKIFSKSHCGERDGRGETNRGGNESRHESDRWMINLRKKMIFASGARQRGAQFAIAKRAAKRHDSADDPQHEQGEPGLNVRQLETETRENAGADDIGNND